MSSAGTLKGDWPVKQEVDYEEIKRWSDVPDSEVNQVILIDVREAADFDKGHIPNSVNLPMTVFEQALAKDQVDFIRSYGFPKPAMDAKIILYCRSGRRSTLALDLAQAAGFTKVRNYKGSWQEYEVRKSEECHVTKAE